MKIKAVCEQTGLTDRTVRYYIEQELVTPAFHENYLGRKTFDFTDDDVQRLKNIALLRSFDFTIREIQELIAHPEHSGRILLQVRTRKEREIERGQAEVKTLSGLSVSRPYTLDEMATALRMTEFNPALIDEKLPVDYGEVVTAFLKSVGWFLATWAPGILAVAFLIRGFLKWEYPIIHVGFVIATLFCMLPTWFLLCYPKFKNEFKPKTAHILQTVLVLCCLNSIPWTMVFSSGIFTESRTDNVAHYFRFDAGSAFANNAWTLEFFPEVTIEVKPLYSVNPQPKEPHVSYSYLHTEIVDDMFLERRLPADGMYTKEVERVRKLFDSYVENPDGVYTTFVEYEWGEWRVLAWYDGQSPFEYADPDYYSHDHRTDRVSLFAYHDGTRKVRYAQYERAEYSGLLTTPYKPHFVALPWGEEAA